MSPAIPSAQRLKVRFLSILAGAFLLLLGGCGTSSAPPSALDLNPYTVDFLVDPAVPTAKAPAKLTITVRGQTPLSKRADIYYEVKKSGTNLRDEVKTKALGDSRFEGTYTFEDEGFYSIVIHVTTSSVHQVVNQQVEVK